MALPTSTIVLGLLTAIPFGLAIRDTVRGGAEPAHFDGLPTLEEDEHAAAIREAEDEEAWRTQRVARFSEAARRLYGAPPASPGPALDGITLGMPADEVFRDHAETSAEIDLATGFQLAVHGDPRVQVIELWASPALEADVRDEVCSALGAQLSHQWVATYRDEDGTAHYHDAAGSRRAVFDPRACTLRFESFASVAAWIDRTPGAVVPLGAIGRPAKELLARLRQRPSVELITDEGALEWSDIAVEGATRRTSLTGFVTGGRIVALIARTKLSARAQPAIEAQLTAILGQPDDAGAWAGRLPVRFEEEEDDPLFVSITAGKLPEE